MRTRPARILFRTKNLLPNSHIFHLTFQWGSCLQNSINFAQWESLEIFPSSFTVMFNSWFLNVFSPRSLTTSATALSARGSHSNLFFRNSSQMADMLFCLWMQRAWHYSMQTHPRYPCESEVKWRTRLSSSCTEVNHTYCILILTETFPKHHCAKHQDVCQVYDQEGFPSRL